MENNECKDEMRVVKMIPFQISFPLLDYINEQIHNLDAYSSDIEDDIRTGERGYGSYHEVMICKAKIEVFEQIASKLQVDPINALTGHIEMQIDK